MAKDLRTFIADCERQLPGEVIHITKEVNVFFIAVSF